MAFYVLDEERRIVRATRQQWESLPEEQLLVAETCLPAVIVTTYFDGRADDEDGPAPLLFATMTQIGNRWLLEARHASWQEAAAGHRRVVARYAEPFAPAAA